MCAQCWSSATAAVAATGGAAGIRAWLGAVARRGSLVVTPRRLRAATVLLVAAALLGSSVALGGT